MPKPFRLRARKPTATPPRTPFGPGTANLDFSPVVIDGREYHHVTFDDKPKPYKNNKGEIVARYGDCVSARCQCGDKDPKTGKTNLYREFPESLNNGGLEAAKASVRHKVAKHLDEVRALARSAKEA